ncbi:hypothetical protein FOVG_15947 [Fusarium oxysporum f. sp. pisi HDV247]|uniref:Uncharacterized protein n=1 Tax=Fusarium oxysporum f. sp. pisi HDV247 TaxID=1080344 RepID=W9NS50_FUSOX|nr:hypothetical protein FOVG_15947 [Fusarium oxysporum f. sp. pisi HDV247]
MCCGSVSKSKFKSKAAEGQSPPPGSSNRAFTNQPSLGTRAMMHGARSRSAQPFGQPQASPLKRNSQAAIRVSAGNVFQQSLRTRATMHGSRSRSSQAFGQPQSKSQASGMPTKQYAKQWPWE